MQRYDSFHRISHEHVTENMGLTMAISRVLQVGVSLSSIIIGAGVLLSFSHPLSQQIDVPLSLAQIVTGLLVLQPEAVIFLGLIILIATPVIRVAISIIAFACEHDHTFVIISSIVLMILFASFLLGKGGA